MAAGKEAVGRLLGGSWEAPGRLLKGLREALGKLLADRWEETPDVRALASVNEGRL